MRFQYWNSFEILHFSVCSFGEILQLFARNITTLCRKYYNSLQEILQLFAGSTTTLWRKYYNSLQDLLMFLWFVCGNTTTTVVLRFPQLRFCQVNFSSPKGWQNWATVVFAGSPYVRAIVCGSLQKIVLQYYRFPCYS